MSGFGLMVTGKWGRFWIFLSQNPRLCRGFWNGSGGLRTRFVRC